MVRTPGPWRCIFSTGKQKGKAGRASVGITDANVAKREAQSGCKGMGVNDSVGGEVGSGVEREGSISVSLFSEAGANGHVDVSGAKGNGSQEVGLLEKGETVSNSCDGEVVCGTIGEGVGSGAELLLTEPEGGGLMYVNTVTGGTTREPPPELVARAEEAEETGDYLIFIPSRCFVSIEASRTLLTVKTSTGITTSGDGEDRREMAQTKGCELTTPDPAAVSASAVRRDGDDDKGVNAWDRLSAASQNTGTPLSQPVASAIADGSVPPGSRDDFMSNLATNENSKTEVRSGPPLTIDLSQGASMALPSVGDGKARGIRDFVEVKSRTGAGSEKALGKWSCTVCTLENRERARVCEVCRAPRPKPSGLKVCEGRYFSYFRHFFPIWRIKSKRTFGFYIVFSVLKLV